VSGAPAWTPTPEVVERAQVTRLMRRHGLATMGELRRWSVADVARFWAAVVDDLGIVFDRPYEQVLDASRGPAWARWVVHGRRDQRRHRVRLAAGSAAPGSRRARGRA
jgi:acetyl-CoA synthetase